MEFTGKGSGQRRVYVVDGEELEEVPDNEELDVMEADDEDADDAEDNVEVTEEDVVDGAIMENEDEDINDMASYVFTGHTDSVYCVAVHPTIPGLIATGGGDDRAFLWRFPLTATAAPEPPVELTGHTDTVTAVGFNFNGNLLLTGSYDGTVRIWQVSTATQVQVLEGPEDVEWAHWHSKGNAVIAGSKDGTIWMWLAHNGQCMMVFSGHDGMVSAGAFSHDGKVVCSGGEDGTVRLWQPRTGVCSQVFEQTTKNKDGHEATVTCMDTEGEFLVTGSMDGTARLYHVNNNRLLNVFHHSAAQVVDEEEEELLAVEAVAFSAAAFHWVATCGADKTAKIWEVNGSQPRCVLTHQGSVVACKWHSSLPLVVTGSLDRLVRVWDVRNGRCCLELSGHSDLIVSLSLATIPAPDSATSIDGNSNIIVSVSDDHTARVFVVDFFALASSL